jgi:ketosteroid isomerase-like protein
MPDGSTADLVRRYYAAWATDDRATLETLLTDDFTFTSPDDNRIDKTAYWEKCWPGSENILHYAFLNLLTDANAALVRYECTLQDGSRFRNMEYLRLEGGKIAEIDVYFGRDVRPA